MAPLGGQKMQEGPNQASGLAFGASLSFILKTWAVWKPFKSTLGEVLDAHCSKSRFSKDVLNEIATFRRLLEPQNHAESARDPSLEP